MWMLRDLAAADGLVGQGPADPELPAGLLDRERQGVGVIGQPGSPMAALVLRILVRQHLDMLEGRQGGCLVLLDRFRPRPAGTAPGTADQRSQE
jgi:hypothetical protein